MKFLANTGPIFLTLDVPAEVWKSIQSSRRHVLMRLAVTLAETADEKLQESLEYEQRPYVFKMEPIP